MTKTPHRAANLTLQRKKCSIIESKKKRIMGPFFFYDGGIQVMQLCVLESGANVLFECRAQHDINMSVVPIDRRLYFPIAVPTPTVGDDRRTVGATDMFLQ